MAYNKEKVKSSHFFERVNNPGPQKGNSRRQSSNSGINRITAYFYWRPNLSDFALGVDNHLVGCSIYLREVLGHQDDGDIIIPIDLSEKMSHLQYQGVIRDRKGPLRRSRSGQRISALARATLCCCIADISEGYLDSTPRIRRTPRNRPSYRRERPPPLRLRSPPGLSAGSFHRGFRWRPRNYDPPIHRPQRR
jgi:hypothetical protein